MFSSAIDVLPKISVPLILLYCAYAMRIHFKKITEKEYSLLAMLKEDDVYQKKPKEVWVSELGIFKKIPVEKIEKEHKFQWKEDIFTSFAGLVPSEPAASWAKPLGDPMMVELQYLINHTNEITEKMALKYFGKEIGWGVVAKEEINQCGKIMMFYAGKLTADSSSSLYRMHSKTDYTEYNATDALFYGNISRFFMHLPQETDIVSITDVDSTKVARANCQIAFVKVEDNDIPVLLQIRKIEPGQPIGFSYGVDYWRNRSAFFLVDKEGNKMSHALYENYRWGPRIVR